MNEFDFIRSVLFQQKKLIKFKIIIIIIMFSKLV